MLRRLYSFPHPTRRLAPHVSSTTRRRYLVNQCKEIPMSKTKLSPSEWQQVKDAPYWVHAALAAAEGRSAVVTRRKESKALEEAIKNYSTNNDLVKDVMADDSDPAKEIENANESNAEKALSAIAGIVQEKLGDEDLDAFNDFLLHVGREIAGAAGEGMLGLGKKVSDKEAAALESITQALRATSEHKTERRLARQAEQKAEWEERQAEERARRDAAKAKADADAKAKAEVEAKAKAAQEAREKAEREKASQAKARAEQMQKQAETARREAESRRQKAAETAEKEAAAAAAEQAVAAEEAAKWIAEHEVVPGDNLSMISQKYYGTQVNWGKIYEANKDVIGANPSLIKPGQRLRIPKL